MLYKAFALSSWGQTFIPALGFLSGAKLPDNCNFFYLEYRCIFQAWHKFSKYQFWLRFHCCGSWWDFTGQSCAESFSGKGFLQYQIHLVAIRSVWNPMRSAMQIYDIQDIWSRWQWHSCTNFTPVLFRRCRFWVSCRLRGKSGLSYICIADLIGFQTERIATKWIWYCKKPLPEKDSAQDLTSEIPSTSTAVKPKQKLIFLKIVPSLEDASVLQVEELLIIWEFRSWKKTPKPVWNVWPQWLTTQKLCITWELHMNLGNSQRVAKLIFVRHFYAIIWLLIKAIKCTYNLALYYLDGKGDIKPDSVRAHDLLAKAADMELNKRKNI